MTQLDDKPIAVWNRAGMGAAALAVLLAGGGLVMAIRQAQAVPLKRIADLRVEAVELAAAVRAQIDREVRTLLHQAARRAAGSSSGVPSAGPTSEVPVTGPSSDMTAAGTSGDALAALLDRPAWVPVVFLYDGRLPPKVVSPPDASAVPPEYRDLIAAVAPRLQLGGPLHSGATAHEPRFLHEVIGGRDLLVAYLGAALHHGLGAPVAGGIAVEAPAPAVPAAILDADELERRVVQPLMAGHPNLQLAPAGEPAATWAEPLAPMLPFKAIVPASAFLSAQHASALRQTLLYVGIMLLVLVALLLVMRATMRVAQREIELSRLKSEFVADVSHELKTPLSLIQMFGETLLEGRARSEDKKQEYYAIITRESKRLTHLINNILDFARIESGKKIYKMQPVHVDAIARDVYEAYRHELDAKGFEHELKVAEGLPPVDGDPDALSQALLNLISNAVKYSDDERRLSLELAHETRRGAPGVLISISDRGIGIRPEDRAHVFDGFFRAPDDKVRKRRGAGLGLALVREIVEAHRGFVEVESRLVRGTTFHIFLPQAAAQAGEPTNG